MITHTLRKRAIHKGDRIIFDTHSRTLCVLNTRYWVVLWDNYSHKHTIVCLNHKPNFERFRTLVEQLFNCSTTTTKACSKHCYAFSIATEPKKIPRKGDVFCFNTDTETLSVHRNNKKNALVDKSIKLTAQFFNYPATIVDIARIIANFACCDISDAQQKNELIQITLS